MIFVLVLLTVVCFVFVSRGHRAAVEASEANLRAKFNAQGPSGDAARKLMRDAGYNV